MTNFLKISWGVSRGESTYGYNICRLDDTDTRKRYRCNGGGYDMVGTVIGAWLEDVYQDRLVAIKDRFRHYSAKDALGISNGNRPDLLYGGTYYVDTNKVVLDGACGRNSMEAIAGAVGVKLQGTYDRRGKTIGAIVTDNATITEGEPA